jgi:hypothetical protein
MPRKCLRQRKLALVSGSVEFLRGALDHPELQALTAAAKDVPGGGGVYVCKRRFFVTDEGPYVMSRAPFDDKLIL